jgi:hypothetical protein
MLEALGNHAKSERLHTRDGFVQVPPVSHDPGQGGHFSKPAAVRLALDFNRERHPGHVAFGSRVSQGDGPLRRCEKVFALLLAGWLTSCGQQGDRNRSTPEHRPADELAAGRRDAAPSDAPSPLAEASKQDEPFCSEKPEAAIAKSYGSWRFKPATACGQPVAVTTQVVINHCPNPAKRDHEPPD